MAGYDELLGSLLQVNLAQLSIAQNEDMRKITAWAAIIAVPTAIAGIYGMNFEYMPELSWRFGYPAVLVADRDRLRSAVSGVQAQRLALDATHGRMLKFWLKTLPGSCFCFTSASRCRVGTG